MPTGSTPASALVPCSCVTCDSRRRWHSQREGTLSRNVCAVTEPPRAPHKPGASWTADEARRFLAAAKPDTYSPLWLLALSTGLRRGELLGLRWSDLDVERGMLTVR